MKEIVKELPRRKANRYSISVSGGTYDRLRGTVPYGGVSGFVDDILMAALDDPAILARLVGKCRYEEGTPCMRSKR
jgi:hypothetical protein